MEAVSSVIIVIHLMVIVALVAVVLLQRSEGGALGIGGGNAFLTSRGQGNVLTRATGILAAVFFATSIALSVANRFSTPPSAILDTVPATATAPTTAPGGATTTAPTTSGGGGILPELNKFTGKTPTTTVPAPDAGTTAPPAAGTTAPPASGTTAPPAQPQVPTSQ